MKAVNYFDYIKSAAWESTKRRFKATKLYRSGRCYVCCNGQIERHIHHLSYKNLGLERMNDLMVLCAICHAAIHKREGLKKAAAWMRAKWKAHASRNHLWSLRHTNPAKYALEVARFFNVSDHMFTKRVT